MSLTNYIDYKGEFLAGPPTPPQEPQTPSPSILETAFHVLSTEAKALQYLDSYYRTSPTAQHAFSQSVQMITTTIRSGGKLIICGIGKSGKIGEKLVASLNSFSLPTVFLHPSEALHGDLGMVNQRDLILFITFSGKTPELLTLLPHLPPTPKIVLTSHTDDADCEILHYTPGFVLPAPILETEKESFGIPAPTTSITVTLALAHALAVAACKHIHECLDGRDPADVFQKNHPGGAIGANFAAGRVV